MSVFAVVGCSSGLSLSSSFSGTISIRCAPHTMLDDVLQLMMNDDCDDDDNDDAHAV